MNTQSLKLCLVTHRQGQPFEAYLDFILSAVQGGVTSVQLREKGVDDQELFVMAKALKALLDPFHIPLIMNDHLAIAKAVGASGIHLGQQDATPAEARALLGETVLIGLSIETLDQLKLANQDPHVNYVAASAVFESQTKRDCATVWGLDGLQHFCQQATHSVVAIGGITSNNLKLVQACGVAGVAVVSAIHDALSPKAAAFALKEAWEA